MSSSQPQAGGAGQQQQQQQGPKLLKADDILRLSCLTDDEKQKYRLLMHNTWNMYNNATAGSPEQTQARTTLQQFSQKFIARERAHRAKLQQQQQQGGQAQPNQAGAGAQQAPVKQEGSGNAGEVTTNQPQQPAQGQNQAQQRPQNSSVDPSIIKHVHEFPFTLPPTYTLGTPEAEAKLKEYKNGYLNMLAKQATLTDNIKRIQAQMQERQKSGQEVPQELTNAKNKVEEEYYRMKAQIEKFRGLQKQWKDERGNAGQGAQATQQAQQQQAPPQQPQQGQQPQQPQRQPSLSGPSGQPVVKEEPQIKVEGGQPQQQQTQAQQPPQFNQQQQNNQQQPPQQNAQGPPSQLQQQQPQQQQPGQQQMQPGQQQMQTGQQQMQRPPPAPHSLSMSQQPQFPQQGQPQQHLPQQGQPRPQINPHQANMQQHQQSNSPHPQSATTNGQPVPLSHQAAISAANRSYTDPARTNTPMQAGAGGSFHAPGSREREQLNNPKMPIPRHLNVTSPMPVNMGQQRPTMSGPTNGAPGPMGQPVISRPPPFQLEGEGDRVLSKRKLDELVRQVTGGSEEALTPEVEDVRLLPCAMIYTYNTNL
jgi:transcription initiation factor TFIID subunit 12